MITAALYIIFMESRVIMAWLSFCEFGENKMVYIIYLLIFLVFKGFSGYGRCGTSMKKDCIYSEKERFLSEFGKNIM